MRLRDEAEFKEYVAGQSLALRRTAYLMCGDWHQAEDLVQNALMRLYRSWSKVQRSDSRDAYVRQVLVRCLIDERRRSWRRERPFGDLPEVGLHMRDEGAVNGEDGRTESGFEIRLGTRDEIFAALAKIPPRQRATLVLRYWEDMSVEQAADVAKAFPYEARDPYYKTRVDLALQACPALRAIGMVLDPSGKHLVGTPTSGSAGTPDIGLPEMTGEAQKIFGVMAGLCYNNEGMASNRDQAMCADLPEVALSVTFSFPGEPDPSPQSGDMSLANRKPGVASGSTAWVPKSTTTLKDGSTVTVSELQNGDRVSVKARRVLTSGWALTIVAWDGYDSTSAVEQPGSVYNPFPFTLEQMAKAASVNEFVPLKY